MVGIHKQCLRVMILFAFTLVITVSSVSAQRNWEEYKSWCESEGGIAYKNPARCVPRSSPTGNTSSPTDNGEAARQAEEQRRADQKAAEAAEAVERQRAANEAKAKKDAAERQKAFEKARDESPLRGGGETTLRGGHSGTTGLRGSRPDTELRGSTPLDDPMVVDAQKVPSGLPKLVEDSIPDTPAGNAVRRGFQAAAKHDWTLALAMFQNLLL